MTQHLSSTNTSLILVTPSQGDQKQSSLDWLQSQDPTLSELHPDVHIVAPEERSVTIDQVRALLKQIVYQPMQSERAWWLVLAAESLTEPAQQALLKLLEEPPTFLQLVLVTNQPQQLLPTIHSRCLLIQLPASQVEESTELIDQLLASDFSIPDRLALSEKYPNRPVASELLKTLVAAIHQHPSYPQPRLVAALQQVLSAQAALAANVQVKTVLDYLFVCLDPNQQLSFPEKNVI
jgi:hypothetical protein